MKFLLTADWHLRPDRPRCRLDADWFATQAKAMEFVVDTARARDLTMVILGDVFHVAHAGDRVEIMAAQALKRALRAFIVAGNHDLPYHTYTHIDMCSFGVLRHVCPELGGFFVEPDGNNCVEVDAAPFGLDAPAGCRYAFTHQLVFPDQKSIPFGCEAPTAAELATQFPDAQWIFTGDMHRAFDVTTSTNQRVVNPGCLLRQTADLIDYQPVVAIVDTQAGTVEWIPVPDPDGNVVVDAYLKKEAAKETRVSAFVEAVQSKGAVTLSFRDNLEVKLRGKSQKVREIVTDGLEQCKGGIK